MATIQDEQLVPAYQLPALLAMRDGAPVKTPADWAARRAEIVQLFERHMFGRSPGRPAAMRATVTERGAAFGGKAARTQVTLAFDGGAAGSAARPAIDVLLYLPADAPRPTPVFLGLNFYGNHTATADPAVRLPRSWARPIAGEAGDGEHREAHRGRSASRWPIEAVIERGYGVATAYYGDIEPDHAEGFADGVRALYADDPAFARSTPDAWGAIAAWAWGLQRMLDHLETEPDVDAQRVAVVGHSRLGKAALWTAATDERFAMAISNCSGCCGAAISRRRFGETFADIARFTHWFCGEFYGYVGREGDFPADQHMLLACIAPRPLYVAGATTDLWADPRGEFLGAVHAGPAYALLGARPLTADAMPAPESPLLDATVGYHLRTGRHDITPYDWQRFCDFADRRFAAT